MTLTGSFAGISENRITGRTEMTLAVGNPEELMRGYRELEGQELDIVVKKHRKRRSVDANAYFHVLVDKLADALGISKPRCKNIMIGRYGQPFYVDGEENAEAVIKTNIPVSQMLENESIHCMPCGSRLEGGAEVVFYKMFRGSSTYDSREMKLLIDGTVAECREQGIETLPPDELAHMLSVWKGKD